MHAGLLVVGTVFEQAIEAGKTIGIHGVGISGQMADGVLAFAVHAEPVPCTGRGRTHTMDVHRAHSSRARPFGSDLICPRFAS